MPQQLCAATAIALRFDRLGGNIAEIAAGVAALAHQRGIRVPDELVIAGFDDSDVSQLFWPPLTTMRQPIAQMAELAVKTLFLPPAEPHPRICCPVELIVRQSTRPTISFSSEDHRAAGRTCRKGE